MKISSSISDGPVPVIRCELPSWDSAQVYEWAKEACHLVRTRPFNLQLRRPGCMLDYGAIETVGPAGVPTPVVWAIYQFDEPVPSSSFKGKPIVGLAIAFCPPAQAWEAWPLTTLDPAEIPLRPPEFSSGGITVFFFGDPHPLQRVLNVVRQIAEQGYCPTCHTYAPPINPYADIEERFLGAAGPGHICAVCGERV